MLRDPNTRRTILASGLAAGIIALAAPLRRSVQAHNKPVPAGPDDRTTAGLAESADAALPQPGDLIWGVNGHPVTAYPGISIETQLDVAKALGFTQYRINLRGDGSPDEIERYLPLAKARGITLLPILHPEGDMDTHSAEALGKRANDLGKAMAARFRGRIPVWECANELENYAIIRACETRFDGTKYPCDWGPAGGVGVLDYHPARWEKVSAIIGGLTKGVKAGDPAARCAVGTAGWGHLGAYDRLKSDGVDWDITVWHDYVGVPEDSLKFLAKFGKPIWITEFNADVGGSPPLDVNQQAEGLAARIDYYRKLRSRYRIEAAHVYELLDEVYWGDTFEARMGLVYLQKTGDSWTVGDLKPAGLVVRKELMGA